MKRSVNINDLRLASAKLPGVKAALRFFARRRRFSEETTLAALMDALKAARLPATPVDVLDVFKVLEDANCGRLIASSIGSPARFRWDFDFVSVGRVAKGRARRVRPLHGSVDYKLETDDNKDEESAEMRKKQNVGVDDQADGERVEYRFMLRPDFEVRVLLPRDFAQADVERFARFLQMLPFEKPSNP